MVIKTNPNYVKYNANPMGIKTTDCVVRSLSTALSLSWSQVFEDLVTLAREKCCMPNSDIVWLEYLKGYKTIPVKYTNQSGKVKRYTVNDICKWPGTYVVQVANHFVCVSDGKFYDISDCGYNSSYRIWRIK